MGRNAGRDEWELPDFDADADVGAAGARPSGTGGPAGRPASHARGVLPAVALIALLAAGIAIGGIQEPTPGQPSPAVPACVPVATDTVPPFALRAAGSALGVGGIAGYSSRPGLEDPGEGWQVPDPDLGRSVPEIPAGAPVEVTAADGICFTFIDAEFAAANLDHPPGRAERRPLVAAAVEPPAPHPGLGVLPDGDWIVRVSASFETGLDGPGGLVTGERYFRIRVGSGPIPTPTPEPKPLVTPAVACGPAPATADDVELVMTVPGSEPVPGVAPGTTAPVVEVPLGEQATLAVTGDACALRWTIDVLDAATGKRYHRDLLRNKYDDPGWISQNRWPILPVIGSYDVVAELSFGPGVDVVRTWRIIGAAFVVPDTFLVASDGTRVRAAAACGVSFSLANGYDGRDDRAMCEGFSEPGAWGWTWAGGPTGLIRDDLPVLRVRAWSRITLEIPGWTITSWNGACGQIEAGEDGTPVFNAPECSLGGYNFDGSGSPPPPAQFLARPGDLVAQLPITAVGPAGRYDARMYARIVGR